MAPHERDFDPDQSTVEWLPNRRPADSTRHVILGLGCNLGTHEERISMLLRVPTALTPEVQRQMPGAFVRVLASSGIWKTPPWGEENQPEFYNSALMAETNLPPALLLAAIKDTETSLGRSPSTTRWGPRTIDIDILLMEGIELISPMLTIPHPYFDQRAFAVATAMDVGAGNWLLPSGERVHEMAVRNFGHDWANHNLHRVDLPPAFHP